VVGSIIPIFYKIQPPYPFTLLIPHILLKISLQICVNHLFFPIYLRVICNTHIKTDPCYFENLLPKVTKKIGIFVIDDPMWGSPWAI
jgi:hypothetical protein